LFSNPTWKCCRSGCFLKGLKAAMFHWYPTISRSFTILEESAPIQTACCIPQQIFYWIFRLGGWFPAWTWAHSRGSWRARPWRFELTISHFRMTQGGMRWSSQSEE
jgi:hypothetical protein